MSWGDLASAVTAAGAAVGPAPAPSVALSEGITPAPSGAERIRLLVTEEKLGRITRGIGMQVPAVRSAHAQVTKKPGTWPLRLWSGDSLADTQPAWLTNPDPRCTYAQLLARTLDEAVWYDKAAWRCTRRGADGYPLAFELLDRSAWQDTPAGVKILDPRIADSTPAPVVFPTDGRVLESVLVFRWEGLGGLGGAGSIVIDLALKLLAASAKYADTPVPSMLLSTPPGSRILAPAEVLEVLQTWEESRRDHATGIAQGVDAKPLGFNAKELQLVEAREHIALEIARAFSLPAPAVQADNGASMEYSTTVENRRELVEAVRLWLAPIEQTLSLHAAPRGKDVRADVTSYVRDDPATRMTTWATGVGAGVLTVDEARAAEPLAIGKVTP